MVNPRPIVDGEPGARFINDTGRPAWQLVCALRNTCGYCLPYHLRISRSPWPVPFHGNCRCEVRLIRVGAAAPYSFCDHAELVESLDEPRRVAAIGRSNDRLVRAGVIRLGDILTPDRVRCFEEAIARFRIPLATLIDAGIARPTAERAYHAARGAAGRDWDAYHRRQLDERIAAAHANSEAVARHIGEAIPASAPPSSPSSPAEARRRHAAELRSLLGSPATLAAAKGRPRRLPEAARRLVESRLGASAGRNVPAFLAAVRDALAAGKALDPEILDLYRRHDR